MTGTPTDRPFIVVEDQPEPQPPADALPRHAIIVQTDDMRPVEPESLSVPVPGQAATELPRAERGIRWLLLSAIGLVGVLAILSVDWLLGLLQRSATLGLAAAVFLVVLWAGVVAWILRELRALARLKSVLAVQSLLDWNDVPKERAATSDTIRRVADRLAVLDAYRQACLPWQSGKGHNAQPADMLRQFEADVLASADAVALRAARNATWHAAGLVALSPTPITDTVLFVGRAFRVLRQIAEAYGHRPTTAGMILLMRRVLADAGIVTVADLAGDALVNLFGGTIVSKISGVAAEASVAAQRMAKFGLLAIESCRPIRFRPENKPRIASLLKS
jgi:putative membrane protein